MPGGRPTDYTDELADKICDAIATTQIGLTRLCESRDDLPAPTTAKRWLYQLPQFRSKYEQAKLIQTNLLAEELADIAKESDYYIDDKGNKRIDPPSTAVTRNRLDAMKWTAARLLPKKWGDHTKEDLVAQQAEALAKVSEIVEKLSEKYKSDV